MKNKDWAFITWCVVAYSITIFVLCGGSKALEGNQLTTLDLLQKITVQDNKIKKLENRVKVLEDKGKKVIPTNQSSWQIWNPTLLGNEHLNYSELLHQQRLYGGGRYIIY